MGAWAAVVPPKVSVPCDPVVVTRHSTWAL